MNNFLPASLCSVSASFFSLFWEVLFVHTKGKMEQRSAPGRLVRNQKTEQGDGSIFALCAGLGTLLAFGILLLRAGVLVRDGGSIALGGPGRCANPLRVLPRALVSELTAALTLAGTTELSGQVLRGDLSQQVRLVTTTQNVDLVHGHGVKEALDDTEDAAEAPGGVDEVQLTQTLRVVVLRDVRGLAHVAVHGGNAGDTDALQIHNRAAGLEQLAGLARAGGQPRVGHLLVLGDKVLQHALTGRDLVHGIEVDLA